MVEGEELGPEVEGVEGVVEERMNLAFLLVGSITFLHFNYYKYYTLEYENPYSFKIKIQI